MPTQGINSQIIIGTLGADPEVRYNSVGMCTASIRVATTHTWFDKENKKNEETDWHRVIFFERNAEIIGEYMRKGSSIYINGRAHTRKWEDNEGNARYTHEFIAETFQMLSARAKGINKRIALGRLGADPEVKYDANGNCVANIRIATTFAWRDRKTGALREDTEWHKAVFFGRNAEVVGEYAKKGSQIYLEGRSTTDKWKTTDNIERFTNKVMVESFQMMSSPSITGTVDLENNDNPSQYGDIAL